MRAILRILGIGLFLGLWVGMTVPSLGYWPFAALVAILLGAAMLDYAPESPKEIERRRRYRDMIFQKAIGRKAE